MQLSLETPDFDYVLRGADGSSARVNDRQLTRSFIVAPRALVEDWPATSVRTLDLDALAPVLALEPEVILLGTGAAQAFNRITRTTATDEDVVKMIKDPDTRFSATPHGVMEYARFMHAVGTVRTKPDSWKDLFMPALHERQGS